MGDLALQDGLRTQRSLCSHSFPEANFHVVQQDMWTLAERGIRYMNTVWYYRRNLTREGREMSQESQGMRALPVKGFFKLTY